MFADRRRRGFRTDLEEATAGLGDGSSKSALTPLQFDKALKDEEFAADTKARLRWFYERSPYYDNQYQKYPVLREK